MMIEIVCEEDLSALLCDPHTAVGTDGWSETKDSPQVRKKIHPRHYGTFPRILGRYVRERGLICLEEAVRKMSALPAQRLGLQDRGLLRERMAADLVIFDPDTIIDRATDHDPRQFSSGINYVFVNGVPVVDCGALTDNSPGLLLRRPC
jgi:N-acyl-D-aspartate/D-glutamate deacylase